MTKTETKAVKPATKAVKKITVTVLTGTDAINAAITSIAKRGKALDKDIHAAAVSTMVHADKHGDVTLANKLIEALPSTARKNALRYWFIAFGRFTYNTEGKTLGYNHAATTQTAKATQTPFWQFKPEAEYVPFNAVQALESLLKRATKAVDNGDAVPTDFTVTVSDLIAKYNKKDVLAA